jgi:hypothetical protein
LKTTNLLSRRHLITACILLVGFGGASAIYLNADTIPDNPLAEFEHSKKFTHSLEVNGGRFALAAHDLNDWFSGLWDGQSLAFTVSCITVIIALVVFFVESGLESDARGKNNSDGNG